ncbi:hypothetical protein ABTE18_21115, partial [Acinetobacter baumannii]
RINQYGVTFAAAAGGNIVFRVTLRAIFKTETEITLFSMTVVIFKPSLTAATKVFNQCPVGGRFPPKGVGKTAGRAENLYRNVV